MPYNDPNITAEVICDSLSPKTGKRLTTMIWKYPRIIMAEVNTHRMLSKSSASSRAIPVKKQIQKIRMDPFFPSWAGKNQSGMQAASELDQDQLEEFGDHWSKCAQLACSHAEFLVELGAHKQIANRLLEPFSYVRTIVTGTDWANLFNLRCHPDAQPEFMVLAYRALEAYENSIPKETDLHLPFGDRMYHGLTEEERIKVAVARCARVSYDAFEGEPNPNDDIRLYEQLASSGHMVPFEHVAKPWIDDTYIGNFQGWVPHRKTLPNENRISLNYHELMGRKPDWVTV